MPLCFLLCGFEYDAPEDDQGVALERVLVRTLRAVEDQSFLAGLLLLGGGVELAGNAESDIGQSRLSCGPIALISVAPHVRVLQDNC